MKADFPYRRTPRTVVANQFRRVFQIPFLERWLSETTRNSQIHSSYSRLVPPEYLYPHPSFRVISRGGIRYRLDVSQVIDHSFYFFDRSFVPEVLFSLIESDTVFIDVGAHIGTAALRAARLASRGTVHAYEPSSHSYADLKVNADMNGFANLYLHHKALGDKSEQRELHEVNPFNRGMNRFLSTHNSREGHSEVVEVTTLDGEVARLGLSRLDLVKIDAEGYEGHILEGGLSSLAQFKPILVIELADVNLRLHGRTSAQVLARLGDLGYTCVDAITGTAPDSSHGLLETDIVCYPFSKLA